MGIMERDEQQEEPRNTLTTRPNGQTGRSALSILTRRPGQGKDLFSRPQGREGRPNTSAPSIHKSQNTAVTSSDRKSSPLNSRIPRPSPSSSPSPNVLSATRRPFTLSDAFKMAEEEEELAAQGSPSPAPRSWRSRLGSADSVERELQARAPILPTPRQDLSRRFQSDGAGPVLASEIGKGTGANDQSQDRREGPLADEDSDGIFSRSNLGPRVAEAGRQLARKVSNTSINGSPAPKLSSDRPKLQDPSPSGAPLLKAGRRQSSADWDEGGLRERRIALGGTSPPRARSAFNPTDAQSPNNTFAWQADTDFTAGDLQVSESPPVQLDRKNTKIDEIRALEAESNARFSADTRDRPRNTKLDGIRARESNVNANFVDGLPDDDDGDKGNIQVSQVEKATAEERLPQNRVLRRNSPQYDEIRTREVERLSRRALAKARLEDIREQNADSPAPLPSIELTSEVAGEARRESPSNDLSAGINESQQDFFPHKGVEPSLELPTTAPQAAARDGSLNEEGASDRANRHNNAKDGMLLSGPRNTARTLSDESQDLLRRLARATSSSPAPNKQMPDESAGNTVETDKLSVRRSASSPHDTKPASTEPVVAPDGTDSNGKGETRATVGFAGLSRHQSADSLSDKRSSMAHSDSDPIERIEAEMKLFAPVESHSERGSIRAPSPDTDDQEDNLAEETPRPNKPDPLTMPTPKVTGAYVETPATVRVGKSEHVAKDASRDTNEKPASTLDIASAAQSRRGTSLPSKQRATDFDQRTGATVRQSAASGTVLRRARSVPRISSPLINSAKPPTVKDDLLEIHRAHHIDDSTLDDIEGLLDAVEPRESATRDQRNVETLLIIKKEEEKAPLADLKQGDDELEVFDRMRKTLNSGLIGIRTAKQGIERLEDKVSHPDIETKVNKEQSTQVDQAPDGPAYVRIPLPRLWRRDPGFRFTFLGLIVLYLAFWYTAESAMCYKFCKPEFCYPDRPCKWSHEDPYWGYALPVKLDQWTTGGEGRRIMNELRPAVEDWIADAWDVLTGGDIQAVDTRYLTWEQRRRRRRRMLRKGLIRAHTVHPEDQSKFDAWRAARLAQERVEAARLMGYDIEADESMAGDEKLSYWR